MKKSMPALFLFSLLTACAAVPGEPVADRAGEEPRPFPEDPYQFRIEREPFGAYGLAPYWGEGPAQPSVLEEPEIELIDEDPAGEQ